MKFTCTAAIRGNLRCRTLVDSCGEFCTFHKNRKAEGIEVTTSTMADGVLFKLKVSNRSTNGRVSRSGELQSLGVPIHDQKDNRRKNAEIAISLGRNPQAYGRGRSDNGTLFSGGPIRSVSTFELLGELSDIFSIVNVHLLRPRPAWSAIPELNLPAQEAQNPVMDTLVVSFADGNDEQANPATFQALMRSMLMKRAGYVYVYTGNPPGDNGKRLDTINVSHRENDQEPLCRLRFNQGLYNVEQVVAPAMT